MRIRIIVTTLVLLVSASAWALSPPQYTVQRKLNYSIGANLCVDVGEVYQVLSPNPAAFDDRARLTASGERAPLVAADGETWVVPVRACTRRVALALAAVLRPVHEFGWMRVEVRVYGPMGRRVFVPIFPPIVDRVRLVERLLRTALEGNCFFVRLTGPYYFYDTGVEFTKKVIQFWNDDIGDVHSNFNGVAAHVFRDVLNDIVLGDVTVGMSTASAPNCE